LHFLSVEVLTLVMATTLIKPYSFLGKYLIFGELCYHFNFDYENSSAICELKMPSKA